MVRVQPGSTAGLNRPTPFVECKSGKKKNGSGGGGGGGGGQVRGEK